jgi:hypothetical protein
MDDYDACNLPSTDQVPTEETPWVFDEGCPLVEITEESAVSGPFGTEYTYQAKISAEYATPLSLNQRIYFNAFEGATALKFITLPDKLSFFDPKLFDGMENLEEIIIENNYYVYSEEGIVCDQETDKLRCYPGGVLEETLTIPASTEEIGKFAFSSSKVETLNLHETLSLYEGAFANLYNLKQINVADAHETMMDVDGVVYSQSQTSLHVYPAGKESASYDILDTTVTIESYAFAHQQFLESLVIPEGVRFIGESAFIYNKALHTLDLPTTLEMIDSNNFQNDEFILDTLIVRRTDEEFITVSPNTAFAHEDLEIYLPDNSMATYEANVFWKILSDYFKALSTLEE